MSGQAWMACPEWGPAPVSIKRVFGAGYLPAATSSSTNKFPSSRWGSSLW